MTDSSLTAALIIITIIMAGEGVVDAALDVNVPSETIAVKGGSAVFEISYTVSGGDTFNSVALNKGVQNVFTAPIVILGQFLPNGSSSESYRSRSSTDYYAGRTRFIITLNGVTKSDEGEYTVLFTKNINVAVPPVVTKVVLDVLPSTPSFSGAPTQSVLGGAGPTVLICTANLGKPQASMVWSRRIGSDAYTNITENVNTTITRNNDGTTSGSSALTVNLDTADDGVQFRCQVSNRQATLSAETGAIEVTAPVPVSDANIQVCKTSTTQCTSPFDYYINDQVSLTCGVTSSPPIPAPHEYKWYKHVNESSVISGPVLSFKITESEIVYVCNASNTVRGVTHTVSKQVTIRATAKPTSRTQSMDTTTSEEIPTTTVLDQTAVPCPHQCLTGAEVAGVVISVFVLEIVLIVLLVILIRRGTILLPCTEGNSSRPNDKLQVQTPGVVNAADTVTYVNDTVHTRFPNTWNSNLDNAVADLLESFGLQSHAPAFEREQITTQSLADLTIEDLTLRLGVALGPSRMMLKRIGTLGLHKQVESDSNQVLDGAYSDVGPPVCQEAVDVAYANVAQTPVYEGLADSTKGAQGDYAKLHVQGTTMGDKPSEYETVMKSSQRR